MFDLSRANIIIISINDSNRNQSLYSLKNRGSELNPVVKGHAQHETLKVLSANWAF